jgi:hypothetical protein
LAASIEWSVRNVFLVLVMALAIVAGRHLRTDATRRWTPNRICRTCR